MMLDIRAVRDSLSLPHDAVVVRHQVRHCVLVSDSQRLVFRVGLTEGAATHADPSDIAHSHRLAWDMSAAGLNVLSPTSEEPIVTDVFVASVSPLVETLESTGWRPGDAYALGRDLSLWSGYLNPVLAELDVPGYVLDRIKRAEDSLTPGLREAGVWCSARMAELAQASPWPELMAWRSVVHGDPNLGNMVRHRGRIELIDLDSVKIGPAGFDAAIMTQYVLRYGAAYPAVEVVAGMRAQGRAFSSERLSALIEWKELSSATQLLQRWAHAGIPEEFARRRDFGRRALWVNVVGTPMG